jgi:hypothetical protein
VVGKCLGKLVVGYFGENYLGKYLVGESNYQEIFLMPNGWVFARVLVGIVPVLGQSLFLALNP